MCREEGYCQGEVGMGVVGILGVLSRTLPSNYHTWGLGKLPWGQRHYGVVLGRCRGLWKIGKNKGSYSWLFQFWGFWGLDHEPQFYLFFHSLPTLVTRLMSLPFPSPKKPSALFLLQKFRDQPELVLCWGCYYLVSLAGGLSP